MAVPLRLRVPDVDDADFVAEMRNGQLVLAGSADHAAQIGFRELLERLDAELRGRGVASVVVDMYGLDRMVAACFRELVAWVGRLQQLPAEERYQIRVRGNPAIEWQRNGLRALACFDTEIVVVEGA